MEMNRRTFLKAGAATALGLALTIIPVVEIEKAIRRRIARKLRGKKQPKQEGQGAGNP